MVPNGVDPDFWPWDRGVDGSVWSGRIVPEKAPHEAVEAALTAGLPHRRRGSGADPAYFRERVQPLLGPTACYLGHLGRRELQRPVATAGAVVVTPAWEEPFGLVAAEAMACGTPVAGYARGALPEVVDGSTGCLVAPGDVSALAAALRRAIRLDRAAARERACRLWNLHRMVDDYEQIYLELAENRGAA